MNISTFALITILVSLISITRANKDSESSLEQYFAQSDLESRGLDDEWKDITVGMIMKRDDEHLDSTLSKRSVSLKRETSEIFVKRDPESGSLSLPTNFAEASLLMKRDLPRYVKHHVKRGKQLFKRMSVIITWYTGHDLENPSCVQKANWAPTDDSLAAAVTIAWDGKPACGKFVKITHKTNSSVCVTVRIVDSCGGCAAGSAHIDLTQAAFKKLYTLDTGLVSGLQAKIVKAPANHKWTAKDVATYGPKRL